MASQIPSLSALLKSSFPSVPQDDEKHLINALYPETTYTDSEKTEIDQWVTTAKHIVPSADQDAAKSTERLQNLNTHLSTRTTVLGSKPSLADLAIYAQVAPVVAKWSSDERTGEQGYHHIVRHVAFVQNAPLFSLKLGDSDKVAIDPSEVKVPIKPLDPKAEKERKKKEKEAAAAAAAAATTAGGVTVAAAATNTTVPTTGEQALPIRTDKKASKQQSNASVPEGAPTQKKEKAPKQPKPQKKPAEDKPLSPALIDLRVGHILKAEKHPNADSLYVSTIAVGDPAGTENTSEYEGKVVRTVCSGLNGLVPLEEMQGRKIVAVCNLKPVTMRGIKSCAMVLAASPRDAEAHAGPVELVNPPTGAEAGERVYFEGWEGEPEPVLNPKKKVWDMCQVGFTTTDDLGVAFDAAAVKELEGKTGVASLMTKTGACKVKSLKGATVR